MNLKRNSLADDEPLQKRRKIADAAFKTCDLSVEHEDVALATDSKDVWKTFSNWVSTKNFKNLTRNEIDELSSILETITREDTAPSDSSAETLMVNTTLEILNNASFQQYFKLNCETYCNILKCVVSNIQSLTNLKQFLKKVPVKFVATEDRFVEVFLENTFDSLIKSLQVFEDEEIFVLASKTVQRCIFLNNFQSFQTLVEQVFLKSKIKRQTAPSKLLKYLMSCCKEIDQVETVKIAYKLIFHALSEAYNSHYDLILRLFYILTHILGFKIEISELQLDQCILPPIHSEIILFELLDIISHLNLDPNFVVKEINLESFLQNMVKDILNRKDISSASYKIIKKCIDIEPLIVNSLIEDIITNAMILKNFEGKSTKNEQIEYENLIFSIFDVYSKLHRFEGLISKIVTQFHRWCTEETVRSCIEGQNLKKKHRSRCRSGVSDNINIMLIVANIISDAILKKFSRCVEALAGWQIVNILKTLYHAMKNVVDIIGTFHDGDSKFSVYLEVLTQLLCTFLSSIRVSEHTVAPNTIEKTVKSLEELQLLLGDFAKHLLNKEHDPQLMQSFLSIAFHWGEIRLMLAYYSSFEYCKPAKPELTDAMACNVTYLHPYLDVQNWCLISERVKNFGETPCKTLLQKLFVQKLQAMRIFEESVTHDEIVDILRNVTHVQDHWKFILSNKFIINNLLPKIDNQSIIGLSRKIIDDFKESTVQDLENISGSQLVLSATSYVCILKLEHILSKCKNKVENDTFDFMSSKMAAVFDEDLFLTRQQGKFGDRTKEILSTLKDIYIENFGKTVKQENAIKISEHKFSNVLDVLKRFPIIYCSPQLQQICFIYFIALHYDLEEHISLKLKANVENIVIGALQHCKFSLTDTLRLDVFLFQILNTFDSWKETFTLTVENVFKNETRIRYLKDFVTKLCESLTDLKYMSCATIILQFLNKSKKTKMTEESKILVKEYKQAICSAILKLVQQKKRITEPLFVGYAHVLKYVASSSENDIDILKNHLQQYLEYALKTIKDQMMNEKQDHLILLTTFLQNNSNVPKGIVLEIWDACKDIAHVCNDLEEYGRLVVLISIQIPNDEFALISKHLMAELNKHIEAKDHAALSKHLLVWEFLIACNLNPIKTVILHDAFEYLLLKITETLSGRDYSETLFENIHNLEQTLIRTNHLHLTPALVHLLLLQPVKFLNSCNDFQKGCSRALSLMSSLLRFRKPLIMDRLPVYLRQYRLILNAICEHANTELRLQEAEIRQISHCAHQLEKLTNDLVSCQKDISRISVYLIADLLRHYENFTLYSDVKMHLNNCIYSLISLCDQHIVANLMRVLSNASTEMFKIMYDNYKKYYRFTGKV
ncbi:unnamed protein product [Acanthoscelides obtectus]|uniref:Nucleolar 27S pre-rRNA processing Urb2/Npa2 C-terminal domain-containing protein n=1 Tax=Acanthoscelides obtectus TaxID=200917 RepID=A0A9P0LYK6_ACAOB|nr:unnamed protein product [Acanthoscelides obtectus]CAK1665131.1 hypothetical protein AOBTE_LOCUS24671 [Acanthoscelides obtectus]